MIHQGLFVLARNVGCGLERDQGRPFQRLFEEDQADRRAGYFTGDSVRDWGGLDLGSVCSSRKRSKRPRVISTFYDQLAGQNP